MKSERNTQSRLNKSTEFIEKIPVNTNYQDRTLDQASQRVHENTGSQNHNHIIKIQKAHKNRSTYKKNKIIILGGKQCTGLASTLDHTRKEGIFECYDIYSFLKPSASSKEILNTHAGLLTKLSSEDKIILCVGEDDCNPTNLFIELSAFIKIHCKPTIIVIGIQQNQHLNVTKLNNMLKLVCNNFEHCTYFDTQTLIDRNNYLPSLCHRINLFIDSLHYKKNYITLKRTNNVNNLTSKSTVKHDNDKAKCKKGTIPYFFNRMTEKNKDVAKKITIPDYFPKISKNVIVVNNNNDENKFFRAQTNS